MGNVETFQANYRYCTECGSLVFFDHRTDDSGRLVADCTDCETTNELTDRGWFYWFCFPGCLPDSEPFGPFATEDEALDDARETSGDDDEDSDEDEDSEPTEPSDEDITTSDHEKFYQSGDLVLFGAANGEWYYYTRGSRHSASVHLGTFHDNHRAALRAYMDRTQYYPTVWFISDHGNAHVMTDVHDPSKD